MKEQKRESTYIYIQWYRTQRRGFCSSFSFEIPRQKLWNALNKCRNNVNTEWVFFGFLVYMFAALVWNLRKMLKWFAFLGTWLFCALYCSVYVIVWFFDASSPKKRQCIEVIPKHVWFTILPCKAIQILSAWSLFDIYSI